MTRFHTFMGSSALLLVCSTQVVLADITPNDVWQDWQDYLGGMGYSVTAKESMSGDTLSVKDVQFDMALSPDQGQMSFTLESLSFVQNADGTVSVRWPDQMPISVNVIPAADTGEPVNMALTIKQSGHDMLVSGTPADMTSTYTADTVALNFDRITIDDETLAPEDAKMAIVLNDIQNTTSSKLGAMRDYSQTASVGSVTYDAAFKQPDEPATAVISGTSANLSIKAGGLLPLALAQVSDMSGMLQAGMDVKATMSGGNSTLTMNIADPINGNVAIATATETSTLAVETSADGVSYAGTRQGMTVSVQPPEFPFLLSFAMDNTAFNLSAPVMKSDAPQNFALGVNLADFTMSDLVWGMINPQGTLPRDPATISLDLSGTATMLADYLDLQNSTQALSADGVPAQLETVNLNALIIEALGAKLTGNGTVTFDNSDPGAEPGELKPTGAIDLKLVGGNTLLDKLVEAGLLPAQMVMGARMMMGMFAVPGDGEDTLQSKLEFTRSGAILANGQRIK
jgi:hypothetical protein